MHFQPLFSDSLSSDFPLILAGPCSAESREQLLATARLLAENGIRLFRAGVWKPRTHPNDFEGVGSIGLTWLQEVKQETGMLTATEIATAEHVEKALHAGIDVLWIGARTTTSPFSVQQIADALKGTDAAVLVKNPVISDVDLWIGAIERLYRAGIKRLGAVHRGFDGSVRYRNAPLWHIPLQLRQRLPSLPLFGDPSHIAGRRSLVAAIAQQAMDLHFNGLMIECHINPQEALSDAEQQITPQELSVLLAELTVRKTGCITDGLAALRQQIDDCDSVLLATLVKRLRIAQAIGNYKQVNNLSVLQPERFEEMLKSRLLEADALGLREHFIQTIFETIHEESVRTQLQ
jgi:chorismate mutase